MTFLRFLTAIAIAFTLYFLAGNLVQLVAPIQLSAQDREASQRYVPEECEFPAPSLDAGATTLDAQQQKAYDQCVKDKQPAIDQARSEAQAKVALAATVRSAIVFAIMLIVAIAVFRHNPFLGSGFMGAGLLFLLLFPLMQSAGFGSYDSVPTDAISETERALILTKSIIEAVLVVLLIAADVFFFEKEKPARAK